ncbi:NUDIX hydrolase, partial [Candidatus Pacearchaeota archaeon]|nr:NUDIX hydrolase [Candidatus Pacearchaeota archaeon]
NIILRELKEEINANGKIIKTSYPYIVNDEEARWIIVPFIIKILGNRLKINKNEHSEVKWVSAKELEKFKDLRKDARELKVRRIL